MRVWQTIWFRKPDIAHGKHRAICKLLPDIPTTAGEEVCKSWTSFHSDRICEMLVGHCTAITDCVLKARVGSWNTLSMYMWFDFISVFQVYVAYKTMITHFIWVEETRVNHQLRARD